MAGGMRVWTHLFRVVGLLIDAERRDLEPAALSTLRQDRSRIACTCYPLCRKSSAPNQHAEDTQRRVSAW